MLTTRRLIAGLAVLGWTTGLVWALQEDETTIPLEILAVQVRADNQTLSGVLAEDGAPSTGKIDPLVRSLREAYGRHLYGNNADDGYRDNLLALYKASSQYGSYRAIVFSDIIKGMILDWAREALATQTAESNRAMLLEIRGFLRQLALDPTGLRVLWNTDEDAAQQPNELTDSLPRQIEAIAKAHGYETTEEWVLEMSTGPVETLEGLLRRPNGMAAAFAVLRTEMVRAVALDGTVEFLLRGGDPAQASATDVRYFRSVMPYRDSMAFAFPIFGVKVLKPSHVLYVLDVEDEEGNRLEPYWMGNMFDRE